MSINVIILGGGFAGMAAAGPLNALARQRNDVSVTLLDSRPHTTMIPTLPDLACGRYSEARSTEQIANRTGKSIIFHRQEVLSLNFDKREVATRHRTYPYDYLLVSAGSTTDFMGFDQHLDVVHTLDSLEDAARIRQEFADYAERTRMPTALVVGGGYTGLELAGNLRFIGRGFRQRPRVCVVELSSDILPAMPEWVRYYIRREAEREGIEIITGASIETFDGVNASLSNGRRLDDVFLCWTTGTKFAIPGVQGRQKRIRDGRLQVDEYLRVPPYSEVFAAGDSAAVKHGETALRKSVNLAIGSGNRAGRNIVAAIRGRTLQPFRPVDLGWVIPFSNVGVGQIFSRLRMRGRLPLSIHYFMCGLRNYNMGNCLFFWGMSLKALLRTPRIKRNHATPTGHVPEETGR